MNKLYLFSQVPVRTAFYFGDKPKRIWLKVSETEAILAYRSYAKHVINPGVLVFRVIEKEGHNSL